MNPPRLIVIDTQSLLDWMVFRNPDCALWTAALAGPGWRWIYTDPMRREFDHVAAKGFGDRWPVPGGEVASAWACCAHPADRPPAPAPAHLRCTDPDDQMFIDLAVAAGAHTLVSRDKAVLRLAGRVGRHCGLLVRTPRAWSDELARTGD